MFFLEIAKEDVDHISVPDSITAKGSKVEVGYKSLADYQTAHQMLRALSENRLKIWREQQKLSAEKALLEAGVAYGDTVECVTVALFMSSVETLAGTVTKWRGYPYVRLAQPYQGKKLIMWNKHWRKKNNTKHGG